MPPRISPTMPTTTIVTYQRIDDTSLWNANIDDDSSVDSKSSDGASSSVPLHQSQPHVHFSENEIHHPIMSLSEFSNAEIRASWYSSEEKQQAKAERQKVVSRLERGKPCKPEKEMTYRGLECWTNDGARNLDDSINKVIAIVLDEQEKQWNNCFDDYGLIASKSLAVTANSKQRAWEIAEGDQLEARSVVESDTEGSFIELISWYRPQKRGGRRLKKKAATNGRSLSKENKSWWSTTDRHNKSRP